MDALISTVTGLLGDMNVEELMAKINLTAIIDAFKSILTKVMELIGGAAE